VILRGFKRARRTGVTVLLLMLGLSVAVRALVGVGRLDIFWGGLLFGSTWIAGFLALWRYYVCPQCGELPLTAWEWNGLGAQQYLDLNPSRCRKCGARLR
jgi:hypothetical protein